jgi:riboflavin kinase
MNLKDIREIHLPDLQFCKLCDDTYGVNRGVYNTIDAWFYNKGIENILVRRSVMIDFLEFACDNFISSNHNKRFKFGHGGLTSKLEEYWVHFNKLNNYPITSQDFSQILISSTSVN